MEEIKTKVCNECKKNFPSTLQYFYKKNNKTLRSDCKKCHSKKMSKILKEKYWAEIDIMRDKSKKKASDYRLINPMYNRKASINLTDAYLSNLIGVKTIDSPKEIIETRRLSIQIKREIKNRVKNGFKICMKCFIEKKLNDVNFYKDKHNKSGYKTYCKKCCSIISKKKNKKKWQEN